MNRLRKFARTIRGAAAIEFSVLVILLSAVSFFSTPELGRQASTTFTNLVWNLRAS